MSSFRMNTPVMLSVAGSDCSAGAGLQADMKAALALGAFPLTVLTCAVSEVPGKVEAIVPMEADFVASQLRLCLAHYPVAALKAGMLYSPEIVRAVAAELQGVDVPLVVDPVMIATAGEPLMQQAAIAVYEECLFPRTALLTPNLDEAAALLQVDRIEGRAGLEEAVMQLAMRYNCAVLGKGGHLAGNECADLLGLPSGKLRSWAHPRVEGVTTHGTGCTLSAAVAALLARGESLEAAVEGGLRYVERAIAQSHKWSMGQQALNMPSCD